MKLAGDLLVAFANAAWTLLLGVFAVRVYVEVLGPSAYGLVGFAATLQAVAQLLDLGLAATVNREIARTGGRPDQSVLDLVATFRRVAWGTAAAIGIGVAAGGEWIASHWLSSRELAPATLVAGVVLCGMLVAVRWPMALHQAMLLGAGRQKTASLLAFAGTTLTHVGGVAVLWWFDASVLALLSWHVVAAALQLGGLVVASHRAIDLRSARPGWREARRTGAFTATLALVGVTGLLVGNADKLLLSSLFDLADFGIYMLAFTLVSGVAILVAPVYNAVFPRFSQAVANRREDAAGELLMLGTIGLASYLFAVAAALVAFGDAVLRAWLGNAELARTAWPFLSLLAAGSAIHGVLHLPFALQIALGRPGLMLKIQLVLLALYLPLLMVLTSRWGVVGAAASWLLVHAAFLALSTAGLRISARFVPVAHWLLRGVAVPAAIAAAVCLSAYWFAESSGTQTAGRLVLAVLAVSCSFALGLLSYPPMRRAVATTLRARGPWRYE